MSRPPPTRHRIFVGKDIHKFSSAHMTIFPDGTKERLHGHNFQVSVAFDLVGTSADQFLDFALVKQALAALCAAWDQRLLLPGRAPQLEIVRQDAELEFKLCGRRYVAPADEVLLLPLANVVVETLAQQAALELVQRLGPALRREAVIGMEVSVTESAGQGGSYYWSWES